MTSKVVLMESQKRRPQIPQAILRVTAQMDPMATRLLSLQRSIQPGDVADVATLDGGRP